MCDKVVPGCLSQLSIHSGHDLEVREFEPSLGLCPASMHPAQDSSSLPAPPNSRDCYARTLSVSLKINK